MKFTRIFLTLCYLLMPASAAAHDWYPPECCSEQDCAEVIDVESFTIPTMEQSLPLMAVRTKFGSAVVPPNFRYRISPDNKMHACMHPLPNGTMRLLCLFLPPSS